MSVNGQVDLRLRLDAIMARMDRLMVVGQALEDEDRPSAAHAEAVFWWEFVRMAAELRRFGRQLRQFRRDVETGGGHHV